MKIFFQKTMTVCKCEYIYKYIYKEYYCRGDDNPKLEIKFSSFSKFFSPMSDITFLYKKTKQKPIKGILHINSKFHNIFYLDQGFVERLISYLYKFSGGESLIINTWELYENELLEKVILDKYITLEERDLIKIDAERHNIIISFINEIKKIKNRS